MSEDPRETAANGKPSPDEARRLSAQGLPYEAAKAYYACGDAQAAVSELLKTPRGHATYGRAARLAIELARELKQLDIRLEIFLAAFIAAGPQDATDKRVFYELAELYLELGVPENAQRVLAQLVASDPAFRDAKQRHAELVRSAADASPAAGGARAGDQAVRRPGVRPTPSPARSETPTRPERRGPSAPEFEERPPPVVRSGGDASGLGAPGGDSDGGRAFAAPGAPLVNVPSPGTTIAGRFRLEEKLGEGGMASVFRATDLEIDDSLAIKVFTELDNVDSLNRFRRELKLARQLDHPNIVRLYDFGLSEGLCYIAMELLTGRTLDEALEAALDQPVELTRGLDYLTQAAGGLQEAHEHGVIHRDVKPDNFFVTSDDRIKVMDFGIAKQQAAPGITVTGTIAGTPQYMSPEQINDFSKVSPATDIYSLGVVAYQLFTGQRPFEADDLISLLMMQLRDAPRPPRELNPEIPEELEGVILEALKKDPHERLGSCRELAERLKAIAAP